MEERERARGLLVRDLHRAVERGAVQGLILVHRERLGLAIDDGARGEHHALHLGGGRGLEHVEGAVDHDLLAFAGRFLAAGPAQRGLVEHDVRAIDRRGDRLAVADVHLAEARLPGRERAGEILRHAPHERVERDDLARARGDHAVHDVRPDVAGSAGDDDARAGQRAHWSVRDRRNLAGTPA